jgi:septal ring factor EnvC (AmiA/AmiB activator)
VIKTYKEYVQRLETELTTYKTEQQKVAAVIATKYSEIARLEAANADLQLSLVATNDALNQQKSQQLHQPSQAQAEEQTRILTSLLQAYPKLTLRRVNVIVF